MQVLTRKIYQFDNFQLDFSKRRLLRDGKAVSLNPKAFDLLRVLIEHNGELLTKDDLFRLVWDDQIVEESNLTVNMSAIRKALGERASSPHYITTVSGRGYYFTADLKESADENLVIESRTVARIVVEEEEIDGEEGRRGEGEKMVSLLKVSPSPLFPFSLSKIYKIAGLISALTILIVGGYFLGRAYLSKTVASVASIKKLTNHGKARYAALSPDSRLFAFSMYEGSKTSLWLGYVDGGEPIEIRPPAEMIYLSLRFSPDGTSLYYVSSENYRRGDLYRIPVFGGAAEKVQDDVRGAVTFAPDGKRIAFVRADAETGQQFLVITGLNGSNEQKIAQPPANFNFIASTPVWSPKGDTIAVGAASDDDILTGKIFIVNTSDKTITPLTTETLSAISSLCWLHDGSGLIVVAREKDSLSTQLWQVSYPAGDSRRIVTDLNLYGGSIGLSVDDKSLLAVQSLAESNIWVAPAEDLGKAKQITFGSPGQNNGWNGLKSMRDGRIIYTKQVNNTRTIWSAEEDGSNQKQLIPGGGINILPSVPDNEKFVIFQSSRSGNPAVWRADIDGNNLIQLTGAGIAAQPGVSPDGKWVVYISDREDLGDVWRISIDGGEPLRLTDTQFSWVDVSPDSRFVAGGCLENGKPKLGIIPIDGGKMLKMFDVPRLANFRLGVHWTPDGQAITYRDWGNGIWKQDINGGEPVLIKDLPEEKLYGYGWSPDGKHFAYTRGNEVDDVVFISNAAKF